MGDSPYTKITKKLLYLHNPRLDPRIEDPDEKLHIIFDGSISLWRSRTNLDLLIIHHEKHSCIEVVAYNPEVDQEAPRLYLDSRVLFATFDEHEIQGKVEEITEQLIRNKNDFDPSQVRIDSMYSLAYSYVKSRLSVESSPSTSTKTVPFTIFLKFKQGDDQNVLKSVFDVSLIPINTLHFSNPHSATLAHSTSYKPLSANYSDENLADASYYPVNIPNINGDCQQINAAKSRWKKAIKHTLFNITLMKIRAQLNLNSTGDTLENVNIGIQPRQTKPPLHPIVTKKSIPDEALTFLKELANGIHDSDFEIQLKPTHLPTEYGSDTLVSTPSSPHQSCINPQSTVKELAPIKQTTSLNKLSPTYSSEDIKQYPVNVGKLNSAVESSILDSDHNNFNRSAKSSDLFTSHNDRYNKLSPQPSPRVVHKDESKISIMRKSNSSSFLSEIDAKESSIKLPRLPNHLRDKQHSPSQERLPSIYNHRISTSLPRGSRINKTQKQDMYSTYEKSRQIVAMDIDHFLHIAEETRQTIPSMGLTKRFK